MSITMIAAVGRDGVIGADGWMPWHLPDDLRRFRSRTMGRSLIMGRRTFEAIGRPLAGRRTIVVTRDPDWSAPGVRTAGSVPAAVELAGPGEVMVAGGGEIYAAALPLADRLELTQVDSAVVGDTYFPTIAPSDWECTSIEQHDGFAFATYLRRDPVAHPAESTAAPT